MCKEWSYKKVYLGDAFIDARRKWQQSGIEARVHDDFWDDEGPTLYLTYPVSDDTEALEIEFPRSMVGQAERMMHLAEVFAAVWEGEDIPCE